MSCVQGDNTRPRSGRRRNTSDDDNLDLLSSDDSDSGNESSSREDSEADEETGEKDRGPDEETGEKKRKSHGRSHVTVTGGASVNATTAAVGSSSTAAKVTASGDHAEGMELEEGECPRVRSFWSEGKEIALPRGRWRVGLLHGKKKFLFLRFATKGKIPASAGVQTVISSFGLKVQRAYGIPVCPLCIIISRISRNH
ncbi:hypothetical protein NP493_210g03037 [Ridgeia piscesae]|uniref:Uncharacterized protein n=1 Tax=Ridgeia piscesae TaxID=27915 RepID=A0AAD9P128_RIDPI|nr:hypothetical protein NP493_210g03037 [Ridgeia piscesae]